MGCNCGKSRIKSPTSSARTQATTSNAARVIRSSAPAIKMPVKRRTTV
jgi:hypothetical protein